MHSTQYDDIVCANICFISFMVYLYYILLLLLNLAVICLVTRIKRSAENAEDILQNREKEYEAEKGRNLATKEDIAEITQKIEQVKSEVSFVNQWKHEHIFQREKRSKIKRGTLSIPFRYGGGGPGRSLTAVS